MKMKLRLKKTYLAAALAVTFTGASTLVLADNAETNDEFANGWKEGKIETAFLFNEHLNNFKLDSEVDGSRVTLTGEVDSGVKKELAGEIADSIEGIDSVDNRIDVVEEDSQGSAFNDGDNEFLASVKDASITAVIKMKYLVNENLSAVDIKVSTENQSVTLTGDVASEELKELAGAIAGNSDDVVNVDNQLNVRQG